MKYLVIALLVFVLLVLVGCRRQVRYHVTLVSEQPWSVGDAKFCSFDGKWMELHCFPPTALSTPKHNYLVSADFERPVHFDSQQWAGGSTYPYGIICRLDSLEDATCRENK